MVFSFTVKYIIAPVQITDENTSVRGNIQFLTVHLEVIGANHDPSETISLTQDPNKAAS